MIVTKEMAQKFLIRKPCYLVQASPDGDYMLMIPAFIGKKAWRYLNRRKKP